MRGLAPRGTTTRTIYAAVMPYFLPQLVVVALSVLFPVIATGLPRLIAR